MQTLSMQQLLATRGAFPRRGGNDPAQYTIGFVYSYAATGHPFRAPHAEGQAVPIRYNEAVYSVLWEGFGPLDGERFHYPDLRGRVAVGGTPGEQFGQHALGLRYLIAVRGWRHGYQLPLGLVMPFAGFFVPDGWLEADGAMLSIAEHEDLFEVIGTRFGGDGERSFALPNLQGAAPLGVGGDVVLGQRVEGEVPGLGLHYLLRSDGLFPSDDYDFGFLEEESFIGHVAAFAGETPPEHWLPCHGQTLREAEWTVLHYLIGTRYGDRGPGAFAMPDLRGAMIAGPN